MEDFKTENELNDYYTDNNYFARASAQKCPAPAELPVILLPHLKNKDANTLHEIMLESGLNVAGIGSRHRSALYDFMGSIKKSEAQHIDELDSQDPEVQGRRLGETMDEIADALLGASSAPVKERCAPHAGESSITPDKDKDILFHLAQMMGSDDKCS